MNVDNIHAPSPALSSLGDMKPTSLINMTPEHSSLERGDVPGWVLITLMTAGLVIVIWSAAGPALAGVFEQAISRVTSF